MMTLNTIRAIAEAKYEHADNAAVQRLCQTFMICFASNLECLYTDKTQPNGDRDE